MKNVNTQSNAQLIEYLRKSGALRSGEIMDAFSKIDRIDFVPSAYLAEAYGDYPIALGHAATLSQPSTVAFMLELLEPEAGQKILDIGAGSGWTTALLAHIVGPKGRVYGVEIVPALVVSGNNNIKKYDLPQAAIKETGTKYGLPEEAPYDRILVSAAAEALPAELLGQLAVNGRMVIPIKNAVQLIKKGHDGSIHKEEFPGFAFVPLLKL